MKRLGVFAVAAAVGLAFPAAAQAEFQSPSTNINCSLGEDLNGVVSVTCEVAQHSWVAPPREPACHVNWGSRFLLKQGLPAMFDCYGQAMPAPDQTLAYNTSISQGTITCYSKITDITCADHYTGHYFRVSRDSYELG
jgi:hypothetical protein